MKDYLEPRCTLICCTFDRERANRAPGRRSLIPLYSPATATRDAVAGDPTSEVVEFAESLVGPLFDWQRAILVHSFSPAGVAPVASVGATTSSAVAGAPEPRCDGLGSQAALDTLPGPVVPGAGAPAATTRVQPRAVEPRLVFPSERMRWVDDLIDDWFKALAWFGLVVIALLIFGAIAVRVSGGAS